MFVRKPVSVIALDHPQLVPPPGAPVTVVDEDGYCYLATVHEVKPNGLIYFDVCWESKRHPGTNMRIDYAA